MRRLALRERMGGVRWQTVVQPLGEPAQQKKPVCLLKGVRSLPVEVPPRPFPCQKPGSVGGLAHRPLSFLVGVWSAGLGEGPTAA